MYISSFVLLAASILTIHICQTLANDLGDCYIIKNNVASCKRLLQCAERPSEQFKQIEVFNFEKTINTIESKSFANCTFFTTNDILIQFTRIKEIKNFAFENMKLGMNLKLTIRIENGEELFIDKYAFYYILLGQKAQFTLEILSFRYLQVYDTLTRGIIQDENSIIQMSLHNVYEVSITKEDETVQLNRDQNFMPLLTRNTTYSLEILQANKLLIDTDEFHNLMINPHSNFLVNIENIDDVYLSQNTFISLVQGISSTFKLNINNANSVVLGESLFSHLIQDESSAFYFTIQNIGHLYDKADDSFCLSKNMFENIQQDKNSVIEISLDRFKNSVLIQNGAFNELRLSDNSKFLLALKNVNGHIVFDDNAINHIKLLKGVFDVSIENHGLIDGNGVSLRRVQQQNEIFFRLNNNSISHVFLTGDSYFRIGFYNSKSIFIVQPKSFYEIHVDRFAQQNQQLNYRTKITIEIKNSEKFRFNLESDEELPILIDVDDYEPILNGIKPDGSLDSLIEDNTLNEKEICRFSQANEFIAKHNLLYFSDAFRKSLKYTTSTPNYTCASCLFLYLYRFIHKRPDFYYVKDHLPVCFLNLFYPNIYFQNEKNETTRTNEVRKIEQTLEKYWLLQDCQIYTGMKSVFDKVNRNFIENIVCSKYYNLNSTINLSQTCKAVSLGTIKASMKQRATLTSRISKTSSSISTSIAFIFTFLTISFIVTILFVCRKQKPIIKLNVRKKFKQIVKTVNEYDNDDDDDGGLEYEIENSGSNFSSFITPRKKETDVADDTKISFNNTGKSQKPIYKEVRSNKKPHHTTIKKTCKNFFSYQSMLPSSISSNKMCTKYENLDVTANQESLDEISASSRKKVLSVIYNVNKKKSSLEIKKNFDDDIDLMDEKISLKMNPMHENFKKNSDGS